MTASLLPRLRRSVAPGGVLVMQVPDSWRAPWHPVPAAGLDERARPASDRRVPSTCLLGVDA